MVKFNWTSKSFALCLIFSNLNVISVNAVIRHNNSLVFVAQANTGEVDNINLQVNECEKSLNNLEYAITQRTATNNNQILPPTKAQIESLSNTINSANESCRNISKIISKGQPQIIDEKIIGDKNQGLEKLVLLKNIFLQQEYYNTKQNKCPEKPLNDTNARWISHFQAEYLSDYRTCYWDQRTANKFTEVLNNSIEKIETFSKKLAETESTVEKNNRGSKGSNNSEKNENGMWTVITMVVIFIIIFFGLPPVVIILWEKFIKKRIYKNPLPEESSFPKGDTRSPETKIVISNDENLQNNIREMTSMLTAISSRLETYENKLKTEPQKPLQVDREEMESYVKKIKNTFIDEIINRYEELNQSLYDHPAHNKSSTEAELYEDNNNDLVSLRSMIEKLTDSSQNYIDNNQQNLKRIENLINNIDADFTGIKTQLQQQIPNGRGSDPTNQIEQRIMNLETTVYSLINTLNLLTQMMEETRDTVISGKNHSHSDSPRQFLQPMSPQEQPQLLASVSSYNISPDPQLVSLYQMNYEQFKVSAKETVKETQSSFDKHQDFPHESIIFRKSSNGYFWIIDYNDTSQNPHTWLFPTPEIMIESQDNLDIIKYLFECRNSDTPFTGNMKFKILNPARVSAVENTESQWELQAKGKLEFSPDFDF